MIERLNHVALAVPDLEAAIRLYRESLGARVGEPQDQPEHGVRIAFVDLGPVRLELMEPLGPASPIARFLERNPDGGLHHLCLGTPDLDSTRRSFEAAGGRVLGEGAAAPGAGGRPVLFLHPKDCCGTLLEIEQD